MKNNIKFIASDLDGTLLNNEGRLDSAFFDVFNALTQREIMFSAASGRQYDSLKQLFSAVSDDVFFIAENGALVMYRDQEIYSSPLNNDVVSNIVQFSRSIEGAHLVVCGKRMAYVETQNERVLTEIEKYYSNYVVVEDLQSVEDDIIKLAICHLGGSEECLYPDVSLLCGGTHQVVVSSKTWLDIMNVEVSKGSAIRKLQTLYSFNYHETMCFGDYFNDLEMLKSGYHSYAMENAQEEVKQCARFIAPSNIDGGVVSVIKEHLFKISC
ncbi:HAD family hydrolase [Vibrio parahaemolyticus]|uniref:HAD family hydrolase n=2 Tax=Vibrio parahaemolyticus TaxID=670 RepID=UPI0028796568|nr:HAD family hydrolase [Vibrio parahaemolyticus]EJG1618117.1 HAD family phosphatase [Vibrio parahaemolyticus]MDS1793078.1 HAD family hydrolase [Vibrio parahaemolyticus]MDS1940956.1 HAD family hydrolase [Vibrio parahaemolyticus]